MSRNWLAIALLACAGICQAQTPYTPPPVQSAVTDTRGRKADPSAVEIPLYSGAAVSDVLQALNDKGFAIRWDPEDVLPTMTLFERPKATRVDKLLKEILTPYGLHADHDVQTGGWRVRPVKKKPAKP